MRNFIVAALAAGLASVAVACAGSETDNISSPTATIDVTATPIATDAPVPTDTPVPRPTEPPSQADRVNCGTGQPSTVQELDAKLLTVGDLPPEFAGSTGGVGALLYEDIGDAYFKVNVPKQRFLGGYTAVYLDPEQSAGRDGQLVGSIVAVFRDDEAASILFAHGNRGDASLDRPVESRMFGANSEALYYEVSGTPNLAGYVISIRTGRVIVYIVNSGSLGNAPSLEATEQLAELVCSRLAAMD